MKRTAAIFGGNSGMGEATARLLLSKGWNVFIVDHSIRKTPIKGADPFYAEVENTVTIQRAFEHISKATGRLDFLMNCTGIHSGKSITDTTDKDLDEIFGINTIGTAKVVREGYKLLSETDGSSILLISSDNGLDGDADAPLYCATKHAIVGLVRSLALTYKRTGVRVNCLCPGPVDTPFLRDACGNDLAVIEATAKSNPLGRLIEPRQIAEVAVLLATNRAMNGCIWGVDGGVHYSGGSNEPPKVIRL